MKRMLGPISPMSLSGVSTGQYAMSAMGTYYFQLMMTVNPTYKAYFKVSNTPGVTATSLSGFYPQGVITDGGIVDAPVGTAETIYFQVLLTNPSGVSASGSNNEYIGIWAEKI